MNILIIGGSGFLGLHLLKDLQESIPSANIYISSSRKELASDTVLFVDYDITESVETLFILTKPDCILHLASCCVRDSSDSSLNKGRLRDDNILKALSGLKLCPNFIFVASMAVFSMGDKQVTPMRYHPTSNYGFEKLHLINKLVDLSVGSAKVRFKIVYPSSIYGKGQEGKMFLPRLLQHIEQNRVMVAFGANKKRDFVHVKDVSRILVKLVSDFDMIHESHIFVHSFILRKISEIANLVCGIRQSDPKNIIIFEDSSKDLQRDALEFQVVSVEDSSCHKFPARITLSDGLQEMFEECDVPQIVEQ